jgi:hypothetical protein
MRPILKRIFDESAILVKRLKGRALLAKCTYGLLRLGLDETHLSASEKSSASYAWTAAAQVSISAYSNKKDEGTKTTTKTVSRIK